MKGLLFGTAGIPASSKGMGTEEGIKEVKRLGLGAMELEFVRSINISEGKAPSVRKTARKEGIVLTAHAPYFINLNSPDPAKRKASADRIVNSARALSLCGGWSVCFHAGYYMGMPREIVYRNVKDTLEVITEILRGEGNKIWIRPEIGGKMTSWGSLEEVIRISRELEGVLPCIDWAHLYSRSLGKNNSYPEFIEILEVLEKGLGKEAIRNMHCHVEGIETGKTGEKNHVNLMDSELNYTEMVKAFRDFGMKGVVISESPNIEEDALLLKRVYEKL
jgi:deoxyribonuclease-4